MREPLILIPGLNQTHDIWREVGAGLSSVVAVMHAGIEPVSSIQEMAEQVLKGAPERFALAGLSMGGYVAMEVMRQAPDRVVRLALLDTTARPDTPEQKERRLEGIKLAENGRFETAVTAQIPVLLHPNNRSAPEYVLRIRQMARAIGPKGYIAQQTAIMNRVDSRPTLEKITCPTLILVGDQDQLTPPELAHEMADLVPNSTLYEVPEAGHLPPIEQAGKTATAMAQFLGAM